MSYVNGYWQSEEGEKQQDSSDHIVSICGKTIGGGNSGVSVREKQQVGLLALPLCLEGYGD